MGGIAPNYAYTASFPCMDAKVGHFINGKLDGIGVDINNVATYTKGEFSEDNLIKGIRSSYRGDRSECFEAYESIDHVAHTAKGRVEYPGEHEVLEGEFKLGFFSMVTTGTLKSTKIHEDMWEGVFRHGNLGWEFYEGKGKWGDFEGEVRDKKPYNAHGIWTEPDSLRKEDGVYEGTWTEGLFDGEWIGKEKYPEVCPECGEKLSYSNYGKCEKCGHSSNKTSHLRVYEKGKIVKEYDE